MSEAVPAPEWAVRLVLCDTAPTLLEAWRAQFARHPAVEISNGHVLEAGCDAVVCPGNGFGFMDGGLALEILERFGWAVQDRLRAVLEERHRGELLVGQAVVLEVDSTKLVYAPVTRTDPEVSGSIQPFLCLRAALFAVRDDSESGDAPEGVRVAVPGVGDCSDPLACAIIARQMRYAYEEATGLRRPGGKNLSALARREKKLKSPPRSTLE